MGKYGEPCSPRRIELNHARATRANPPVTMLELFPFVTATGLGSNPLFLTGFLM